MFALLFLACSCVPQVTFGTPIPVDGTFERVPATGDERARYERAAAYSAQHGGRAVMVLRGDQVVFETGQNGFGLEEPHHLYSGTKSFSCALFESARKEGLMTPDERIRHTLTELPEAAETATIDHLLHLTSGTEQDALALTIDSIRAKPRIDDKYAHTLGLGWNTPPGETFRYGAADFNLFGELVKRKTGEDPVDYLTARVLDPIGLRLAGWIRDPAGNPPLGHGAFTTANEWAKFGVLVRDDGNFLGEQIFEPGALAGCLEGSEANPAYGRTWWLNEEVPEGVERVAERHLEPEGRILYAEGPADLVAAAGHHEQRLYVIKSLDLVVVRLSNGSRRFRDAEFLSRMLDSPDR